jgi:hypothetical protein
LLSFANFRLDLDSERLWKDDDEGLLRNHVHDLRSVLGEGLVETVVGRGYRFTPEIQHADSDFTSGFYSQSCPNFGFNCVETPQRIEQIAAIATNADPTCEVCIYSSPSPTPGNLVRCIAAGKSASSADFVADGGAAFPALVRLDDGTNCAAY